MLSFVLGENGTAIEDLGQVGAYVVGSDGVPLRAEMELREGQIVCAKRADGPAAISLLWPVPGYGAAMLETSRLLDREKPYNLPMELARGRLMRISLKREDWGLFDFEGIEPLAAEIEKGRDLLVEALKADTHDEQGSLGNQALKLSMLAGEKLSHFHADIFLTRRKQMHAFTRRTFGCAVDMTNTEDTYRQALRTQFDFVYLPISWRSLEPAKGKFEWTKFDAWVEWFAQQQIPIRMGPLVSFSENNVPAWVLKECTDFETVRNLVFDHVRRLVDRYNEYVCQWDVVSGVHAENAFDFNFEQLMEVTRVTTALVRQIAPQGQTMIDLVAPWGEYYARNQRTIPPMLYADMVVQSGVGFDGIGVQFLFGRQTDGMFVRDMFQISEKLDRMGNLGKPVHITAVQVPSKSTTGIAADGGCWRKPWDEAVQAQWVKEFYTVALSKPFVESITWLDLADRTKDGPTASGGLLHADLKPKPAFKVYKDIRADIKRATRKPPASKTRTKQT